MKQTGGVPDVINVSGMQQNEPIANLQLILKTTTLFLTSFRK
ncbi:hypothetical protein [Solitalea lacus]|nr:hypothetical protein [Solitalea lacus]